MSKHNHIQEKPRVQMDKVENKYDPYYIRVIKLNHTDGFIDVKHLIEGKIFEYVPEIERYGHYIPPFLNPSATWKSLDTGETYIFFHMGDGFTYEVVSPEEVNQ